MSQCLDYQFDGDWIMLSSAYEKEKVENNIQKQCRISITGLYM